MKVKILKINSGNGGSSWIETETSDGPRMSFLAPANIDISQLKVGESVDFSHEDKMGAKGRYGLLKAYMKGNNPPVSSLTTPVSNNTGLSEPELRFVSNVVGAVIAQGMVTQATEVAVWAKAARDALYALGAKI